MEVKTDGNEWISLLIHYIRWLFFVEGVLTCIVAVTALSLIPDFPTTRASWLTTEEHILSQERMVEDGRGTESDLVKITQRSGLAEVLTDRTVWWFAVAMHFLTVMLSFDNFFPTLAATMGYSPIVSLFLCSPPWILSAATSLFIMRFVLYNTFPPLISAFFRHSDATRERFWHVTGPILVAVIGFTVAIFSMNTAVRYLSL